MTNTYQNEEIQPKCLQSAVICASIEPYTNLWNNAALYGGDKQFFLEIRPCGKNVLESIRRSLFGTDVYMEVNQYGENFSVYLISSGIDPLLPIAREWQRTLSMSSGILDGIIIITLP